VLPGRRLVLQNREMSLRPGHSSLFLAETSRKATIREGANAPEGERIRGMGTVTRGRTVGAILGHVRITRPVRRAELRSGDHLIVVTENSSYSMTLLEDATFSVRGGWFDRQGLSPVRISIAGCTWGGSVIKVDIVAAYGLRLEFGNRVVTSRIREVHVIPEGAREGLGLRPVDGRELFLTCYGTRWETASAG
jgi:hypothetical protein